MMNVPLVASEVSAYCKAWLFALAMLWDIDLNVDLSDRAAEAAFALVENLHGKNEQRTPGKDDMTMLMDTDGGQQAEEATAAMVWDEPEEHLPPELNFLWSGVQDGKRKLDLRALKENVPGFKEVPRKALDNNYRSDSQKLNGQADQGLVTNGAAHHPHRHSPVLYEVQQ